MYRFSNVSFGAVHHGIHEVGKEPRPSREAPECFQRLPMEPLHQRTGAVDAVGGDAGQLAAFGVLAQRLAHVVLGPHHVQQIIRQKDKEDISDYDIWMLIMHVETTTTTNSEANEMAQYYQQIAYASYANQLYGGGYGGGYYGGYGGYGYGGYGYGYNNYYNYMMMAQYAAASATTTSTSLELDKDRFYEQ